MKTLILTLLLITSGGLAMAQDCPIPNIKELRQGYTGICRMSGAQGYDGSKYYITSRPDLGEDVVDIQLLPEIGIGSGGYSATEEFNSENYYLSSNNGLLVIRDKKTNTIQAGDMSMFLGHTIKKDKVDICIVKNEVGGGGGGGEQVKQKISWEHLDDTTDRLDVGNGWIVKSKGFMVFVPRVYDGSPRIVNGNKYNIWR